MYRKNKYPSVHLLMTMVLMAAIMFSFVPAYAASDETATFTPTITNDVLNNPYVGFAPNARTSGFTQNISLVYMGVTWRELEPTKGTFDFAAVESTNQLATWAASGKKAVLRILLDVPGSTAHRDVPDWLYNEIGGAGTVYDSVYGKGYSPDYENATLLAYHQKLISALGARYNKDSRIAFIELGSIGHWGEWHTLQISTCSIPFPKLATTDKYVGHYVSSFPDKKLLMRRPDPNAVTYGMGLFNDMFGDHASTIPGFLSWVDNGYQSWLTKEWMPAMPEYWKTAPSGGEMGNGSACIQYFSDANIAETLTQAVQTHVSWLGPNGPVYYTGAMQANINRLLNTMGYRFAVRTETHAATVTAGTVLGAELTLANLGVAPFYYPWKAEVSLVNSTGAVAASTLLAVDIRSWLPGDTSVSASIPVPASLAAGSYRLAIAILDPDTGKPGVLMPMAEKTAANRYLLGTVAVMAVSPSPPTPVDPPSSPPASSPPASSPPASSPIASPVVPPSPMPIAPPSPMPIVPPAAPPAVGIEDAWIRAPSNVTVRSNITLPLAVVAVDKSGNTIPGIAGIWSLPIWHAGVTLDQNGLLRISKRAPKGYVSIHMVVKTNHEIWDTIKILIR